MANIYRTILFLTLFAILGACGDVSAPKVKVNGIVSKGPIGGATVTVYALNSDGTAGEILGTAITDSDGSFAVEIENYTGNVLVVSSEGQYIDEATGATKENPGLRTALDNVKESNYVAVTALTEIAARRAEEAGGLITGNISDANAFVTEMVGNIDIVSTRPADVLDPSSLTATEDEKEYGLILAGMSQMVADAVFPNISAAITDISADLADDNLDQTGGDLVLAVETFASSPSNNTGVFDPAINLAPVANAGQDLNAGTGSMVTLDGSGSSDANNDTLTYNWSFVSTPEGSSASLSNFSSPNPTFTADLDGIYVLNLTVNDGMVDSAVDLITVTASVTRNWGLAELIETDNTGSASDPKIAFDASGNAIAVWNQHDGTRYNIWANRYMAGSGWGTAELVETLDIDPNGAWHPQIAVDASGNAIAVWEQNNGIISNRSIWANRYTAGSGWGTAELIDFGSNGGASPQVVVDGSGNAIVVWTGGDGTYGDMVANSYSLESGWGTPEIIGTGNAGHARYPGLAIDNGGNAIAVWTQSDGTNENAYANRYTAGTGWGTAELIENNAGNAYYYPEVDFDKDGNAIAVWSQNDGTYLSIYANRYTVGSGWGAAELIEPNINSAQKPHVAVDAAGNAIVGWWQYDDTSIIRPWINSYIPGSGWGTAELLESAGAGNAQSPQIAFDSGGNAIAVWPQSDGMHAKNYISGSGWGASELIEESAGTAGSASIAFDGSGNAITVWKKFDGTRYNIWANSYL